MTLVAVFDCETTGKLSPDARIIEVSLRLCEYETQREIECLEFRCNPERNIEAMAVRIHGITSDDVKKLPTFEHFLPLVEGILDKADYLLAHNLIGFDYIMLKQEFERYGKKLPEIKLFDTMVKGTFATELGKSPSLAELCYSLDIDYNPEEAHSGSYDTLVLRNAFFNGVKWDWFKLTE